MRAGTRAVLVMFVKALAGVLYVSSAVALEVGQKAPDFTLTAPDGEEVRLDELTAKGPVVLFTFLQAFDGTCTRELMGFDAAVPQFEALGAQLVSVSTDGHDTLARWLKANPVHYVLLSDFTRKMLSAYGAMVTNEQSPIYRYAKRAYFIIDRQGTVRWMKVQDNPLHFLNPSDVLKALKESGAW